MNDIAVPTKTILIVEIIGVTLFLEKEENSRHRYAIVSITILENTHPKRNLHTTSSSDSNSTPL